MNTLMEIGVTHHESRTHHHIQVFAHDWVEARSLVKLTYPNPRTHSVDGDIPIPEPAKKPEPQPVMPKLRQAEMF